MVITRHHLLIYILINSHKDILYCFSLYLNMKSVEDKNTEKEKSLKFKKKNPGCQDLIILQ